MSNKKNYRIKSIQEEDLVESTVIKAEIKKRKSGINSKNLAVLPTKQDPIQQEAPLLDSTLPKGLQQEFKKRKQETFESLTGLPKERDKEDELYEIPENLESQSIPFVPLSMKIRNFLVNIDLGIQHKLDIIEANERAKRSFLENLGDSNPSKSPFELMSQRFKQPEETLLSKEEMEIYLGMAKKDHPQEQSFYFKSEELIL